MKYYVNILYMIINGGIISKNKNKNIINETNYFIFTFSKLKKI